MQKEAQPHMVTGAEANGHKPKAIPFFALISIDKIDDTKQMVRSGKDDDHVIELANSISVHGLLEPIVVTPAQDGAYTLVAGYHRLQACQRLGYKTIPAMINTRVTAENIRSVALVENIIRRDMSLEEEILAIKTLQDQDKLSVSQITQAVGRSRAWVMRRIAADSMPDDVRVHLFSGAITLGAAESIATIPAPEARALVMAEAINGRRTEAELKQIVEVLAKTPNIAEAVEVGVQNAEYQQRTQKHIAACEACGTEVYRWNLRPVFVCATGCPDTTAAGSKHGATSKETGTKDTENARPTEG